MVWTQTCCSFDSMQRQQRHMDCPGRFACFAWSNVSVPAATAQTYGLRSRKFNHCCSHNAVPDNALSLHLLLRPYSQVRIQVSACAQGVSGEYDAASAAVSAARQVLNDSAEDERAAFSAAGAEGRLANRICIEHAEDGVVLRVRVYYKQPLYN